MEGLWGSLGTMPIRDLLSYAGSREFEGTIRCESGSQEKTLVVQGGGVIRASSNDPREYLGQFLINYGHIDEEQLTRAFETQQETKVFLGRILVMIGLLEEAVIREMLSLKVRETVLSLLGWEHGQFHFSPEPVRDIDPAIEVTVPLVDILREAESREAAWTAIRRIFPHEGLYLELSLGSTSTGFEHPLDERIVELAAQGQTIAEIALSLHATPFAFHERLLALHGLGVVSPVSAEDLTARRSEASDESNLSDIEIDVSVGEEEKVPSTLGEQASIDQIVALARDFLSKGRYGEARAIAARAVEMAPQDDAANSALKESETGMLAELRQSLLERRGAPRVTASKEDLAKGRYSPAERYLLKRFDGEKPLSSVLKVSPIKEVEALKIVSDMIAAGVVEIVPKE